MVSRSISSVEYVTSTTRTSAEELFQITGKSEEGTMIAAARAVVAA